ncbi:MAG: FIST C-terminal domain-containing protein, partial [Myxococcota bacterium]
SADIADHQVVQFHLRDAQTSADDLRAMLANYRGPQPRGALMFSCMGRGAGLYGTLGHDSQCVEDRFGQIPVTGFFGHGELGPVGGQTYMHGYTCAIGLFAPAEPEPPDSRAAARTDDGDEPSSSGDK